MLLPVALIGYLIATRCAPRNVVLTWLVLCSTFYHAWWRPAYTLLLVASIRVNYGFGWAIRSRDTASARKACMVAGVAFGLLLLGFFKYSNLSSTT